MAAQGAPAVTDPSEDGFDADIAAVTIRVEFYQNNDGELSVDDDAPARGDATFAADGTKQDALAERLVTEVGREEGDPTFSETDTPVQQDERIQHLDVRADTVLSDPSVSIRVAS